MLLLHSLDKWPVVAFCPAETFTLCYWQIRDKYLNSTQHGINAKKNPKTIISKVIKFNNTSSICFFIFSGRLHHFLFILQTSLPSLADLFKSLNKRNSKKFCNTNTLVEWTTSHFKNLKPLPGLFRECMHPNQLVRMRSGYHATLQQLHRASQPHPSFLIS